MSDNKKEQYEKNHQDFLDDLAEQVELLRDYCKFLDEGKMHYSKPLATAIRVLVHQTPSSTSLLKHLNALENMSFLSTSKKYENEDDIIILVTLITAAEKIKIKRGKIVKKETIYVPNLDKNNNRTSWLNYEDWYKDESILISNEITDDGLTSLYTAKSDRLIASRMSIVTFFSNKDGGAHVDRKSEKALYRLSKNISSFNYKDTKPLNTYNPGDRHVPGEPFKYPLQAALRQIAHELLLSLDKEFSLSLDYQYSHTDILGYDLRTYRNYCVTFDPDSRQMSILD